MKNITKLFTLSLLALSVVSCGNNAGNNGNNNEVEISWNDSSSIKLEEMSASISLGETYQIKASGSGVLSYVSNNPEVAIVSSNGLITSVSEGDAAIKVSNNDDFVYFRIHIGQAAGQVISGIPSIYLANNDISLYIGETYTLSPKLLVDGKEISGSSFKYESTNSNVASVNDGVISAVSNGTATIKVTGSKESTSAFIEFNVTIYENLIYLVPDFETREVVSGTPLKLNFVLINNSTMITSGVSNATYSVNDTNLAYVSGDELFSIHKGLVTVSAEVTYNSVKYSCDVDIKTRELYKVTYTANDVKVYEEYVISDDCISYKEIPTKKDSVFNCWGEGDSLVYNDTPILRPMNLTAKWLVYSNDISSDNTVLLWDYSTGTEITCTNGCGLYLWEDYQYPDTRVNIHMTKKTGEVTRITLPKFEYGLFPAVSFYFYPQIYSTQFRFGSYTSNPFDYGSRNQASIVGNKLFINGVDTGQQISEAVINASEGLTFEIVAPIANGGKICITGFYCHLAEE